MLDDLLLFLGCMALCACAGILAGILLLRRFPEACRRYGMGCESIPWWCFALLFLAWLWKALEEALQGRWWTSGVWIPMAILAALASLGAWRRNRLPSSSEADRGQAALLSTEFSRFLEDAGPGR